MIKSVKFRDGYPVEIRGQEGENHEPGECLLKGRTFKFTPGLNVLFGPNMTGKSTILKTIAIHGLTRSAWSNLDFMGYEVGKTFETRNMQGYFDKQLKFNAKVDIDGPVYWMNDEDVTRHQDGKGKGCGYGHGMFDYATESVMTMEGFRQSAGEKEMVRQYNTLANIYEGKWAFSLEKFMEVYEQRKGAGLKYVNTMLRYAKRTVLKGGRPTILLDEPERHLGFENADSVFSGFLPQLANECGYQIIVASHYMMLPFMKDYNIIWLDRDEKAYKSRIAGLVANGK